MLWPNELVSLQIWQFLLLVISTLDDYHLSKFSLFLKILQIKKFVSVAVTPNVISTVFVFARSKFVLPCSHTMFHKGIYFV